MLFYLDSICACFCLIVNIDWLAFFGTVGQREMENQNSENRFSENELGKTLFGKII